MVSFVFIDVAFLIIFSIAVTLFLYKRRTKLDKEGIMFLYRTQLGVKFINAFSKKYGKILKAISPLVILVGYILMGIMVYLLYQTTSIYVTVPNITDVISAPPVMPLIPYFPQIFGVESLMPPFYFTYFILALLIVAVVHEFSHGIFMKTFGVKIKSTGFAFLGPILGAFVEEEKRGFKKKKIKEQLTILGAGVFANIIFALIFFILLIGFFHMSYTPIGYNLNIYVTENGSANNQFLNDLNLSAENLTSAEIKNLTFYFDSNNRIMENLGTLEKLDNKQIFSSEDIKKVLENKNEMDIVPVTILLNGAEKKYNFTLNKNVKTGKIFIGFGNTQQRPKTVKNKILDFFTVKKQTTEYAPNFETADFFYNLIWWVMVINFLVGLFNMLPLGILDGGRFFYLTVLAITGKKKTSEKAYKLVGKLILLMFILMMVFYFINLFS